MANTSNPNGLVPYAPGGGASATNFVLRRVQINYSYATKIFKGDPVAMQASGYIAQWSAGTGVSQLAGVFWGCEYLSQSLGYTRQNLYWPATDVASTSVVSAFIIPCDLASPMWFLAQSGSTGLTQADVGSNVDFEVGSGSTTTGISAGTLGNTLTTTNTLPFKIMALFGDVGGIGNGTSTGAYARAYVAANITSSTGV